MVPSHQLTFNFVQAVPCTLAFHIPFNINMLWSPHFSYSNALCIIAFVTLNNQLNNNEETLTATSPEWITNYKSHRH